MKPAAFVLLLSFAVAHANLSGFVAVANREGGTVSLVNPRTLQVKTVSLPGNAEPMYVAPVAATGEVWVGDRRNSRLVVLKLGRGGAVRVDGTVRTPAGPFHSLATQQERSANPLVFTACDEDDLVVVHDARSRRTLCTMGLPKEVATAGARPHDVTGVGRHAYVTFLGGAGGAGFVASYVARSCRLIAVTRTAEDPHVAVRPGTNLFVAAQGGEVLVRSVPRLRPVASLALPSPHGIFIGFDRRFVYVTNIAGGGDDAVVVLRVRSGRRVHCPRVDTTFATPHNPALSRDGRRLFITHSIAGKKVNSAWKVNRATGCVVPGTEKIFETGLTPFGIAVLPRY